MKNLLLITGALTLSACSNQDQEWEVVSFPLYKECDHILEKIDSKFALKPKKYELKITKSEFGAKPKYGNIPYGIGSLQVRGDMELMNGTQVEYLQLHLTSMFAVCMPNNSVVLSGPDVPAQIEYQFGSKLVSGSAEDGKFYVLFNDGTYSYQ